MPGKDGRGRNHSPRTGITHHSPHIGHSLHNFNTLGGFDLGCKRRKEHNTQKKRDKRYKTYFHIGIGMMVVALVLVWLLLIVNVMELAT